MPSCCTLTQLVEQNNDGHGAGSPALRVYWQTVKTFGEDVNEVQSITTVADQGQNLGGTFRLTYKGSTTESISCMATPQKVERCLLTNSAVVCWSFWRFIVCRWLVVGCIPASR